MKNKRGFLLGEETVKIVIAVVVLIFLFGLLGKLYYSYSSNKELRQAEESLNYLLDEMSLMKVSDKRSVDIWNPVKWCVVSEISGSMPDKCVSSGWTNCLCICVPSSVGSGVGTGLICDLKGCKAQSVCLSSEKVETSPIVIEHSIQIEKESGLFRFS